MRGGLVVSLTAEGKHRSNRRAVIKVFRDGELRRRITATHSFRGLEWGRDASSIGRRETAEIVVATLLGLSTRRSFDQATPALMVNRVADYLGGILFSSRSAVHCTESDIQPAIPVDGSLLLELAFGGSPKPDGMLRNIFWDPEAPPPFSVPTSSQAFNDHAPFIATTQTNETKLATDGYFSFGTKLVAFEDAFLQVPRIWLTQNGISKPLMGTAKFIPAWGEMTDKLTCAVVAYALLPKGVMPQGAMVENLMIQFRSLPTIEPDEAREVHVVPGFHIQAADVAAAAIGALEGSLLSHAKRWPQVVGDNPPSQLPFATPLERPTGLKVWDGLDGARRNL